MALSFIGKPISLISHSDVRYRGILAGIDPAASTIQLSNVFSMGTESRRPVGEYIPPVQEPYQYIIFRASEVKDLSVDEQPAPRRSVHDDPAVLGVSSLFCDDVPRYSFSAGIDPGTRTRRACGAALVRPADRAAAPAPRAAAADPAGPATAAAAAAAAAPRARAAPPPEPPRRAQQNAIHTAAASLETVERALGDLRVSSAGARRQRTRRPGPQDGMGMGIGMGGGAGPGAVPVPAADFDFASMNAKFDKAALAARAHPHAQQPQADGSGSDRTNPSDDEDGHANGHGKEKERRARRTTRKSRSSTRCRRRRRSGPGGSRGKGKGSSSSKAAAVVAGAVRAGDADGGGADTGITAARRSASEMSRRLGSRGAWGCWGPARMWAGGAGMAAGAPRWGEEEGPAGGGREAAATAAATATVGPCRRLY
ncbi:Scd6-like Sm domain-containing protein [Mycena rosella]|uniref:Scd6-like Sm domain-containing protein n=1 Tax=Mycena rosella TaxID=1033263 RepID=A0AAD7FEU9_MYCRO|nr:Scd6-like Sm domain-containing protein [Mycena rosella]